MMIWATGWISVAASSALAQIRPDRTLPNRTILRTQGQTRVITGGTRSRSILLHSFRDFSIRRGQTASFQGIDPDIDHIITRITGSSPSRINGMIEALQTDGQASRADFWLINPNGIWFGRQASLNLGGAFLATTAERLLFANGSALSAVNPQIPPLLNISVPIGLQFGQNPGSIQNASIAPLRGETGTIMTDPASGEPFFGGLQLVAGKTLALIGGEITFAGGVVTVPGGRVELGSVGTGGQVNLINTDRGWRVDYPEQRAFQDMRFDAASVDVSDVGSGRIHLRGRSVWLTNETFFTADTLGDRDGQEIRIRATDLTLTNLSLIGAQTEGTGKTADIRLETDRLTIQNGSFVAINTYGAGSGGNLIVNSRDTIDLVGGIPNREFWEASGLFNQVSTRGIPDVTGDGGNIILTTRFLRVLGGAQINSTTFAAGDAGGIQIRANQVELAGVALNNNGQIFTTDARRLPIGSGIFAGTGRNSSGNGGAVRLVTDHLGIRHGAVLQTTTFGSGNAGEMLIQAAESVEVAGTDVGNRFPSSLIAASGGIPNVLAEGVAEASGRGGTLQLQTDVLRVSDGATIAVGSLNPDETIAKGGGTATIQANTIDLSNQGRILTSTASGNGGNVAVNVRDRLTLRQNSQISTSAGRDRAGGDGGNITVDADYILAVLTENSDITANAYTGTGGNITITANGILGISSSDRLTSRSEITASSTLGVNGTIQINAPDVDPSRGLTTLPAAPVNAQLDQRCQPGSDPSTSRFIATGRGGLLPTPEEIGTGQEIWQDWRFPPSQEHSASVQPPSALPPATVQRVPLLEAQGWQVNATGSVVLTTDPSTVTSYGSWQSPSCHSLPNRVSE
ncbi:MAG: S-layer family protein [Elainella sp. Prado103]|nr:S-layer family protein [Elainella sp. Prado103]